MKSFLIFLTYMISISMLVLFACGSAHQSTQANEAETNTDIENLNFTVEEAPEWTALFHRTSGWFGGDGIYAIPLNGEDNNLATSGTKTMLIFSDTMIGEIADSTLQPGAVMVNNSVAYLEGGTPKAENLNFRWDESDNSKPKTIFIPNTPSAQEEDYYWLGDGFVNTSLNNTMYIFAYRMRNMDKSEAWSFKEMSTDLIALPSGSSPPFKEQRQIMTPLRFEDGGFGADIFVNTQSAGAPNPDGYVYVYGVRGKEKNLIVAKVLPEDFENFSAWRFWDGSSWNENMRQVAFVTQNVSNELSVSVLSDGRYVLVFQLNGMSSIVALRLGQTPYGPFGPVIEVWDCQESRQKNYITYNAKAHPNLSAPGELLISYNVNAFNFMNELESNPNLYRPRFLNLKLK